MVQTEPADLMILDVVLPGISGLEVLLTLRDAPETATLPVIVVSGQAQHSKEDVLGAGADRFLPKPVSRIALLEAALTLLKLDLL